MIHIIVLQGLLPVCRGTKITGYRFTASRQRARGASRKAGNISFSKGKQLIIAAYTVSDNLNVEMPVPIFFNRANLQSKLTSG